MPPPPVGVILRPPSSARVNTRPKTYLRITPHYGSIAIKMPRQIEKRSLKQAFNPRPAGPLDFPPPAGGGAFERPPPMISAPGRRREKRKAAFESSRKIILKSFRSFFGSGQN